METCNEKDEILIRFFEKITNREKEVLISRYGLLGRERKTLEQIGKRYGLTRERIRQIQAKCLNRIRTKNIYLVSPKEIPLFFTALDNRSGVYILSSDICRIKYTEMIINNMKIYLETDTYEEYLKLQKYTKSLSNSIQYNHKITEIIKFAKTLKFPEELLKMFLDEIKSKRTVTDRISEILENAGYPMHFIEIHKILSKSFNIGLERNVLAAMQRREDMFVRVNNGVYTIKSKENPESVPFIKEIILDYLVKNKEGTPIEIYNYVSKRRQCSYSSISMFLTFSPQFEEIRSGVYSLRDLKKLNKKDLGLDNVIESLFKKKVQIRMDEFISEVQRELPEISMTSLYEYLNNNSKISVQDNFILKSNERNS
jgi:hypothetical protein